MDSAPNLPKVGETIAGRFELGRVLGEGGMGIVYEALDRRRKQHCAVKILFPQYADRPDVVARFDREAKIGMKLEGPHIARLYDVGALPGGVRYIAMELLVGRDLAEELDERGRLPVSTAVHIATQTAQVMAQAHALGIVHRDLKPSNLFLSASKDGSSAEWPLVKVLDFGISRLVHNPDGQITTDFAQLGTPKYMAPEQIESAARVDGRADVWALGVVLYEMLVGRPPFEGKGTEALFAIASRPVPRPSSVVGDIPPALEAVVMHALEKSAAARIQSMEEFARALAPWTPDLRSRRRRRSRIGVVLIGVAGVAAASVAALEFDARSKRDSGNSVDLAAPTSASAPASTHSTSAASAIASSSHPSPTGSPVRRVGPARSVPKPSPLPHASRKSKPR